MSFARITNIVSKEWLIAVGIVLASATLAFLLSLTSAFENLELKSYDLRFALRGAQLVGDLDVAIVAIDEQSFSDLSRRWPFPRDYYARLIDNLTRAQARLIVFDVVFTEPAENAFEDSLLAEAAKRSGRVIFAGKVDYARMRGGSLNTSLIKPIPLLLQTGSEWALVNVDEDQDGFVRRYLLYQPDEAEKALPLALRVYLNLTDELVQLDWAAASGGLRIGGRELPRYDANSFLINYRGPAKTFPTYSFASVLDDENFSLADSSSDINSFETQYLPGEVFKDKIVLIGATVEELQDNKFAPFFSFAGVQRKLPGVEVHANALSTLMRRDFITRTPLLLEIGFILLAAGAGVLLLQKAKVLTGVLFSLLQIALVLVLGLVLFTAFKLWMPVIAPVTAIVLSYVGNTAQVLVKEQRERQRTKRVFEQYVSESVVNSILASGKEPEFGGTKRRLTVLFSDIRGFTAYCEKHTPEVVVQRLNEYLTLMTGVVFKHQGTLDKFVGDEIMALFGAPVYFSNHAEKACETACEMIDRLRELQKRWSANAQEYFHIGIGINTGPMIVGNLGAQQKFDYTVIGDEVNLGARLEGANKQYWTSIIISESTYMQAPVKKRARVRELDWVRVKGKRQPVKIFELRSMAPLPEIEQDLIIGVYSQGLEFYKQREWYRALREFQRVVRYFPSDGPSRVYLARCLNFLDTPPPLDWNGVYEFKTK